MLSVPVPGAATIELTDLITDVNGTLTDRGRLIDGVGERVERLSAACRIHLVSADTFGTLDELARPAGARRDAAHLTRPRRQVR